jgi:hypothetical protein
MKKLSLIAFVVIAIVHLVAVTFNMALISALTKPVVDYCVSDLLSRSLFQKECTFSGSLILLLAGRCTLNVSAR